jgi:pimeloyl-ACP methyl ester carboxylesterase
MTKSTAGTSSPVLLAGLAGDLHGRDDARAPLVLLHGLSYDRRTWQPVLDALEQIDPGRRTLVLDLPGHGDSPIRLPHTTRHISEVVHAAVEQAGLPSPVVVGHSAAGGIATVYASTFPVRGVVNVDSSPTDLPVFAAMIQQLEPKIRGGDFDLVWSQLEAGFRLDALPADTRTLVQQASKPRADIALSYWSELLDGSPADLSAMVDRAAAALAARGVPYLLVMGSEPSPALAHFLRATGTDARVEVWANGGHFAHLALVERFAAVLAQTGEWSARATSQ